MSMYSKHYGDNLKPSTEYRCTGGRQGERDCGQRTWKLVHAGRLNYTQT